MMNIHDCMEYAIRLTAERDYHHLTERFLEIITTITGVTDPSIYEVFSLDSGKVVEKADPSRLIIREVMGGLDTTRSYHDMARLYDASNPHASHISPETLLTEGVIFPVPGAYGMMRILVVKPQTSNPEIWNLVSRLLNIYGNLLRILDEKERDKLTSLFNRQTFDQQLIRVLELSQRHARKHEPPLEEQWISLLDIDYFKKINDRFGHLIGDEVLLLVARLMEQNFRHTDLLFRYGGEEFVVVIVGANLEGCHRSLERFRNRVADYLFPIAGQVTISIGYTRINSDKLPSSLIDEADQALYFAKDHGRNQVIYYGELQHAGKVEAAGEVDLF